MIIIHVLFIQFLYTIIIIIASQQHCCCNGASISSTGTGGFNSSSSSGGGGGSGSSMLHQIQGFYNGRLHLAKKSDNSNNQDNYQQFSQYCKVCRFNATIFSQLCSTNTYGTGNANCKNQQQHRDSASASGHNYWELLTNLDGETIDIVLSSIVSEARRDKKWAIDWICCRSSGQWDPTLKKVSSKEWCTKNFQDRTSWAMELSKISHVIPSRRSTVPCPEVGEDSEYGLPAPGPTAPASSGQDNNGQQPPNGQGRSRRRFDLLLACLTIISILLLAATITIYFCLPSLLNIHGKTIVMHLICLMITYCFQMAEYYHQPIIRDQQVLDEQGQELNLPAYDSHNYNLLTDDENNGICFGLGIGLYLFSFSAFLWLCIVNFDIFTTFITDSGKTHPSSTDARRRFGKYCIFGFGLPILLTILILILDYTVNEDSDFKPMIGSTRCFIPSTRTLPIFLYYYGPITLLLIINLGMFSWTSIVLWSIQTEASKLKKNTTSRTQLILERMFLFFKLFCVMGTTMTINIALWSTGNHHEVPTGDKHGAARFFECFNVFHGFCYFIVFVCKPAVVKMLGEKFCSRSRDVSSSSRSGGTSRGGGSKSTSTKITTSGEGGRGRGGKGSTSAGAGDQVELPNTTTITTTKYKGKGSGSRSVSSSDAEIVAIKRNLNDETLFS